MFTRQQILEIQQKLASNGYKDGDFKIIDAWDITRNEYVAVVVNNQNKRILLSDLRENFNEGMQAEIPDIATIRSNAAKGATAYQKPANGIPASHLASAVQSALRKANSSVQRETDPTVPSWAKEQNKPEYTAEEVGALPDSTPIPSSLAELDDDENHRVVTDLQIERWNNVQPSYTLDDTPTEGSGNPVKSGGIYDAIKDLITKNVNDLVNYYKKTETYTQSEVNSLIGAIQQFHYEIAASTSAVTSPASNVLYLIGPTGSGADKYEEYVYSNSTFVKIGDTSIDLSGYVTTSALNTALADYTTTSALTSLLSAKADKSEMSVVDGTDANTDKTTITLKSGTAATVLKSHQDISGKENTSNKRTSWQNTPDNDHYPSEKLVKDSLDGKQAKIDNNNKLDYSLISNTPTETELTTQIIDALWAAAS